MGSAYYYLKATFPKSLKEKNKKALENFFLEIVKAGDWWQDNRDGKDNFWTEFESQFSTTALYLKSINLFGKDYGNGLAGKLSFGAEEDIENNLFIEDDLLKYHAEVWHFAEWESLGNFLKSHFGALSFKYLSDEYIDCYDILDSEETTVIVQDILKQKSILPTLLGINPTLDAMISKKMAKK